MNELLVSPEYITGVMGISRTTLFRWEDQGIIPKAQRGPQAQRLYTPQQVDVISAHVLTTIRRDIELCAASDSPIPTYPQIERIKRIKFFSPGKLHDQGAHLEQLDAVGRMNGLSDTTIDTLVNHARQLPRGNKIAVKIFNIMEHLWE